MEQERKRGRGIRAVTTTHLVPRIKQAASRCALHLVDVRDSRTRNGSVAFYTHDNASAAKVSASSRNWILIERSREGTCAATKARRKLDRRAIFDTASK